MSKATVLIVEDDVNLLEGIRDILRLDGYDVLTAENGEQGCSRRRMANRVSASCSPAGFHRI